jgi:mannose-6-phosphate isomerase-like protein (cupin superfamily)
MMVGQPSQGVPQGQRLLVTTGTDVPERRAGTGMHARRIFQHEMAGFESSLQFVLLNRIPAGEENTRHVHEDVEKVYFFLRGEAEIECGPWTARAHAGDFVFFPAAIEHRIRSLGPEDLEFIVCAARTLGQPRGLEGEAT